MKTVSYTAAGGVVVHNDQVLLLHRFGAETQMRLPKGHVRLGETLQEAALREVTEESGYFDLRPLANLGCMVVEFDWKDEHVVRNEHYFLMRLGSLEQIERERHDQAQFNPQWLSWEDALTQLTYDNEQEWVRRARQEYQDIE